MQSMGDIDIHYRANCAWVQRYPVTLRDACKLLPHVEIKVPHFQPLTLVFVEMPSLKVFSKPLVFAAILSHVGVM